MGPARWARVEHPQARVPASPSSSRGSSRAGSYWEGLVGRGGKADRTDTLPRSPPSRSPVSSAKGESRWTSCCHCPHGQASPPAAAALVGARTPFPSVPPAAGTFLNDPGRREESVLTQQPPGLSSFQGGCWFRGPCPRPGWTWGLGCAAPGPPALRCVPSRCPGVTGGFLRSSFTAQLSSPCFPCHSAEKF